MRNDFETDYLMHWGIKKGGKKENHKYYERVEKNGKYLYFYTQAEYEAWLHKGNKALDKTKDKAKNALSSLKSKLTNTKSSLLNAVAKGREASYQLANRSSLMLKKSNTQQVIDRGQKTIASILNSSHTKREQVKQEIEKTKKKFNQSNPIQDKIYNKLKSFEKVQKKIEPAIREAGKKIQNKVESTIRKAGKNIQKVAEKYVRDGEKAINKMLNKAGNVSLNQATAQHGEKGSSIITTILATAAAAVAVAAVRIIAPKVIKKAKELIDKIFNPETTITITTETTPKEDPSHKEPPPKDFSSDSADSYKEDRAAHSDVPQKDKPTNRDDDMAAVNPNFISEEDKKRQEELAEEYYAAYYRGDMAEVERIYDEYMAIEDKYAGYMNNCMNCTLIYDLRRRGYDVEAPWNPNGTYTDTLYDWYELKDEDFVGYEKGEGRAISKKEAKQLKEALEDKYPEGSYGHLNIQWAEGGGHDVVWSIENGEAVIRDCQTGQVVKFEEYATKSSSMIFVRTDDKKLKDQAYEVAVAEKANVWGKADNDQYEDDDRVRDYDLYAENNQTKIKNKEDVNYDEYWRKAAGKRK